MVDPGPLTIIMYHYVRDLPRTRYPQIKGLPLDEFREQVGYFRTHYHPVTVEEVTHAIETGDALPPRAVLLTFDDGYLEHYTHCFPILFDAKIQGAFYAPVLPVRDRELLDVNRVHFLLASTANSSLAAAIDHAVERAPPEVGLHAVAAYRGEWAKPNRFDTAETIYVKRMLQVALPEAFRTELARNLFATHVSVDEAVFVSELYCDADQLSTMRSCGMHLGSHGTTHRWLNHLTGAEQRDEIAQSLDFLRALGAKPEAGWSIAYPYGGFTDETLAIVRDLGGRLGVTTEVRTARPETDDPLCLPRYDTNDFR